MKLYMYPLSGHAHRAQLFLSLLGVEHELVEVDLAKGAQKQPDFLKLNPFGQVPVLDDDGTVIPDSNAILVYLAKKTRRSEWLPDDAVGAATVQRWLSVAAGQIASGPAAARLITVFGRDGNPAELIGRAHDILALIDNELETHEWIAGTGPTIADVALYSYVAAAPEGNVDLTSYTNVNAWIRRVQALPGFVPFKRTPVGLAA